MPPRLCILGYGKVARELHRPAWTALARQLRVRPAVVCEPSSEGAALAQAHFPEALVLRRPAEDVLNEADYEIVDICTPGHTHAALVLQALGRGAAVLVEKPLCHSVQDVDEIVAASVHQAVSVCHSFRLSPPVQALHAALDDGRLGEITRVQITHHARHALNESGWVTRVRPDGVMFENGLHLVDLAIDILGPGTELTPDAVKFYETSHVRVLTGFELLAHDQRGRQVTIDFLQDSLVHSALHTRVLVSGTGADAELRFSPPGFRLLAGVVDPLDDLRGDTERLVQLGRGLLHPARRANAHLRLASDLVEAAATGRPPLVPPTSVRPTIALLERLAELWAAHPPSPGPGPTTAFVVPVVT